jgi:hypothetical protein
MELDLQNGAATHAATIVLSHSTMADIIYPRLSVQDILNVELVCRATRMAVKGAFLLLYSRFLHYWYCDNLPLVP